ncbi:MAG: hypothetical protein M3N95_06125 [Actinomycetota bacterium]|nr:hypothetical protein [Actinomycetota bacterium]
MDITTTVTTAALRMRGESSFMVPTGVASWHRAASAVVLANTTSPIVARDARTNAKQAGPPRGVPR